MRQFRKQGVGPGVHARRASCSCGSTGNPGCRGACTFHARGSGQRACADASARSDASAGSDSINTIRRS